MKIITLQVNKKCGGYSAGQTVNIRADSKGVPLDKFWRDRLKDSEFDNCVSLVKKEKPKSTKEKEQ